MAAATTFVLVPGAGHGGWQWAPVARRLRAAGHDAITLTLPGFACGDRRDGLRLSDATACVVRAVLDRDLPARGVPLAAENPAYERMIRDDIAATPDGTTAITREQATLLIPGAPESTRDLLFELLEPTPGRYYTDALDLPDLTTLSISLAYLLSEEDRVLARPGTEFAARLGLSPTMLPGGHDAMLSHPDHIAKAILHA
jgi:hypothetical protein